MASLDQEQLMRDFVGKQQTLVDAPDRPFSSRIVTHPLAKPPAQDSDGATVDVSIVIPLLNEEENLERLYGRLRNTMSNLDKSFEIIFVDDGSIDSSFSVLQRIQESDDQVQVIRLRRNFGQTAAFSAGFDAAHGNVIVTLDADLQNDPADIPRLLERIDAGCDVVSGWRLNRQDPFLHRRLPSIIANSLISRVTGVRLHDYGCSLKAYRREIIKNVRLYGEMHRFIPALASSVGARIDEVPVHHEPRRFGQSKYGLGRTLRVVLDLMTVKFLLSYATRPIQVFGLLGMLSFIGGGALGTYLVTLKLLFNEALSDRPLLLLAILLIVLGVQLVIMGLLGELVVRTYYEAQKKQTYVVRELLSADRHHTKTC